ncbi:hypothetical protein [Rathayibacter soli]|uniref:hypothetical protein n=1 Tax=Rathayibacter soli TaxID=3144168 RepID=UPI0027E4D77F|nr:hypothetical protein [Glaciibacter superstes]
MHDTVHVFGGLRVVVLQQPPGLSAEPCGLLRLTGVAETSERLDEEGDEIAVGAGLAHG